MRNIQISNISYKLLKQFLVLSIFCITSLNSSSAIEYYKDTLWTKKYIEYINDVKLLKDDKIIALNGYKFLESENGNEIKTIDNADNKKFVWFEIDKSFIIHNNKLKTDYIYNIENFEIIDSIVGINCLPFTAPHKRIFADTIDNQVRIWDYESKKMIKTIQFPTIPHISRYVIIPYFSKCDDSLFYIYFYFVTNPNPPFDKDGTSGYESYIVDFQTFTIQGTVELFKTIPYYDYGTDTRTTNDCSQIISNTNTGKLLILDSHVKNVLKRIDIKGKSMSEFCISDDNHYLVGIGYVYMTFIDLVKGEYLYSNQDGSFYSVDISKDNQFVIASNGKRCIKYKTRFNKLSIDELNQTQNLIYPNPTNNFITLNFQSNIPNVKYSIFNSLGEIKTNGYFTANINETNKLELDFSAYPSAVYFVNLECGFDNFQTFKIIKE